MLYDAEVILESEVIGEISIDRDNPPKKILIIDCSEYKRFTYKLVKAENLNKIPVLQAKKK